MARDIKSSQVHVTTASSSRRTGARNGWSIRERRYTHGGILAALIDLAADWAMVKQTGRGVPTIDLRVDYHRPAMPGDLTAHGKVIRGGSQFATAEAQVFDARRQAAGQRPRHLFHGAAEGSMRPVVRSLSFDQSERAVDRNGQRFHRKDWSVKGLRPPKAALRALDRQSFEVWRPLASDGGA